MNDPEDEDDRILAEDVIHHAVIPDAESMKRVCESLDRLDSFATDSAGSRRVVGELLESLRNPDADVG